MENLRLYEAEVDYTSEKDTHEYPTVSYCKENDTVYYMTNATTFDIYIGSEWHQSLISPNVTSETMTFEYVEGMTWAEWCESEYNSIDIYPFNDGDYVGVQHPGLAAWVAIENSDGSQQVHADDVIAAQTYIMHYAG